MGEHLRLAACYWHTFVWPGADMFGVGTFKRPWQQTGDPMAQARDKAEAAFDFFSSLGIHYYTFHDTDVAPEGASLAEYRNNFAHMVDVLETTAGRDRHEVAVGHGQLLQQPALCRGRREQPAPGSLRLRRHPGAQRDERHAAPQRRQLRAVGRS